VPQIPQAITEVRKGVRTKIRSLASRLADVDQWQTLAEKDPDQFRAELDEFLAMCKKTLNIACGIESHRPKNEMQNSLVVRIKQSRPTWSYGQVALEYNRQTGENLTAKQAERIYKRTNPDIDSLVTVLLKLHKS